MGIGKVKNVDAIIDTGATRSCVNKDFYIRLKEEGEILGELPVINFKLAIAVGKKKVKVDKQIMTNMIWCQQVYSVIFLVVDNLFADVILGLNWLKENEIIKIY